MGRHIEPAFHGTTRKTSSSCSLERRRLSIKNAFIFFFLSFLSCDMRSLGGYGLWTYDMSLVDVLIVECI